MKKFSKEFIADHKDCFTDKELEFHYKLNGVYEEDEITLETILDSYLNPVDKCWFILNHCDFKKKDIGNTLIKFTETTFKYYSTLTSGDNFEELIEEFLKNNNDNSRKVSPKIATYRSNVGMRSEKSENAKFAIEKGIVHFINALELIKKNKKIIDIIKESLMAIAYYNKGLISKPDLRDELIENLKEDCETLE